MEPKFRNKDGSLTIYAMACGYVELTEFPASSVPYEVTIANPPFMSTIAASVRLFQDGCFHVQTFDPTPYSRTWDTMDTLGEARKVARARIAAFRRKYGEAIRK